MPKSSHDPAQLKDLLLQMMETELGGAQMEAAIGASRAEQQRDSMP